MKNILMIFVFLVNLNACFCQIDSMKFTSTKDNSIFSESNNLSDGAGYSIYAGRTNSTSSVQVRRGLIKFDVSSLPQNAVIQSVKLTLTTLKSAGNQTTPHNFTLHKILSNWGEGTSVGNGSGAAVTVNDATWQHTFYPTANWITNGGDFVNAASATTVGVLNEFTEWSSIQMVSDVSAWISNPAANFGWLIKGQEDIRGSAKGFASKEGLSLYPRTLTIYYALPIVEKAFINEVNPLRQWVEIYNPNQPSIDLTNYYLANGISTIQLNNSLMLNGNMNVDSSKYTVVKWSGIGQNDGEIALYNGNPAHGGTLMKDYIQYGSANHQRVSSAVTAQVWDTTTRFLPTILADTASYAVNGNNNYSSGIATTFASYLIQKQTPSLKNITCPTSMTLNGNIIEATYSTTGQLKLIGNVSSTSTVKFYSTQFVEFQPISVVDKGAFFEAKIGGCGSN